MIWRWAHGVTTRKRSRGKAYGFYSLIYLKRCATCHLNTYACPGHVGHIELPVPVYHMTYMDQLLRLLRAKCVYCGHLKLHPAEVNRFVCKLRLIKHGLVKEVADLENIRLISASSKIDGANADAESQDEEEQDEETLKQRRDVFVRRAIKNAGGNQDTTLLAPHKFEAVAEVRRAIIKEFLAAITKSRHCGNCKGWAPCSTTNAFWFR